MNTLAELEARVAELMRSVIPRPEFRVPEAQQVVAEAWRSGRQELAREFLPLLREAGDGERATGKAAPGLVHSVLPPPGDDPAARHVAKQARFAELWGGPAAGTAPARDDYLTRLDSNIRVLEHQAGTWADEAGRVSMVTGLLTAREIYRGRLVRPGPDWRAAVLADALAGSLLDDSEPAFDLSARVRPDADSEPAANSAQADGHL